MPRGGVHPPGPEKHENPCFWRIVGRFGDPQGPRGMPEAMAVDPESISSNGDAVLAFSESFEYKNFVVPFLYEDGWI